MKISLAQLIRSKGQKKEKRVGRGDSSGHGTYAGRGSKGQKSRTGGKSGLVRLGLKETLRTIPKKRGFKSFYPKMAVINLDDLNKNFQEGEQVTSELCQKKGLADFSPRGLKILGQGELTKKLTVKANHFSQKAKDVILKAGGKVEVIK